MTAAAIIVLAAVFFGAGLLKIVVPARGQTLASRLAETSVLAKYAVAALPYSEIVLASLLLIPATRAAAAIFSVVLISGFSFTIVLAWRKGDTTPCGCFGPTSHLDKPFFAIARNLSLLVTAVLVSFDRHATSATPVLSLAAFALALSGVVVAQAIELRSLAKRSHLTMPLATPLDLVATMTNGELLSVRRWLQTGRNHILVFIDPICGPCLSLLSLLAHHQLHNREARIVLVSRGPMDENAALAKEFHLDPIAVQVNEELSVRLGVTGTPTAIALARDGQIVGRPAIGRTAIVTLLGSFQNSPPDPLTVSVASS